MAYESAAAVGKATNRPQQKLQMDGIEQNLFLQFWRPTTKTSVTVAPVAFDMITAMASVERQIVSSLVCHVKQQLAESNRHIESITIDTEDGSITGDVALIANWVGEAGEHEARGTITIPMPTRTMAQTEALQVAAGSGVPAYSFGGYQTNIGALSIQ